MNFGKKMASHSRSFETAVSSLDFVYRKLQQIQGELHVGPNDDKWKDLDWSEIPNDLIVLGMDLLMYMS